MRKATLIAALALVASCEDADIPKHAKNMTLQEDLALLDGNPAPDTNDIKVIRIKYLLNSLSERYKEPKDTIAEWTSKAQGVLHDRGIQETNLNILEEINKMGEVGNTPYRDAATLYVVLRSK